MKHVIKPALSLFAIAAIVTALLGLARNLTLQPIEKQRKAAREKTMKAVLADADNFREVSAEEAGSIVRVFEGLKGSETIGYVIELSPAGYSGAINMMVGISKAEDKITGMRVVKHSETPGLGALAVNERFYGQFDGRKLLPLRVVRTAPGGDDIEAITAATITSRAITNAVNEAIEWYTMAADQPPLNLSNRARPEGTYKGGGLK